MRDVTLRPGNLQDLEAMYRLDLLCFSPAFRFSRRTIRSLLAEPGGVSVLAEASGGIAGFVLIQQAPSTQEAYVSTLDVHPEQRRRGIARLLMMEAERIALDREAGAMMLHVWTANLPAIRFYRHLGYTSVGVVPDYYGSGMDAELYRKSLGGLA